MAVARTNLTDTIVTARKFVQVGSDANTLKSKLRAISSAVSSADNEQIKNALNNLTVDSVITPQEKELLSAEWTKIQSAYAQTQTVAEELELKDTDDYKQLEQAFNRLRDAMYKLLSDMNSSTPISNEFNIVFNGYVSTSSAFNSYMISVKEGIEDKFSAYRCFVDISPADITLEDTVTLSARIMNGTTNVTNQVVSDIGADKAFNWEFSGTKDDEYYNEYAKGKQAIEVPASDIFASSRFDVRFYAELEVSSL